ncbi:S8 family peptidase [Enterococcus faecalis]|uniref:S8 family peptidase n=1 Tax=Enterococcus faecalis TaxID=1351 RepID=UPI0001F0DA5E|nr:S8 family peptidase [Enterococcus faecalis]EFT95162.1 hypothetical protein HMPREF9499_00605 [Enterococcus faecalis TX0012]
MVEKKNIFLVNTSKNSPFASRPRPSKKKFPVRENGIAHAEFIQQRLKESYERSAIQKRAAAIRYKTGTYLEFSGAKGCELALETLENTKQGIRILNVREEKEFTETDEDLGNQIIKATVYVPKGKEANFLNKIDDFFNPKKKSEKGTPRNNNFVTSIEDIHLAMLDAFWIGNLDDMPEEEPKPCEVWLRFKGTKDESNTREYKNKTIQEFINICDEIKVHVDDKEVVFPERVVKLITANKEQLKTLIETCDYIAEFRRAPEKTHFFDTLSGYEQQEWIDDLLERTDFIESNSSICLLDTGLAMKHPLVSRAIKREDVVQSVAPEWGTNDHAGHGTQMAGVAIFNDLKAKLITVDSIQINHHIESVKILPPVGENETELYGAITQDAVFLAEIEEPNSNRVICMAVTSSEYNTEDGSPTSWSAAVDNISSGGDKSGDKRLFLVSSGNVFPEELGEVSYPDCNILHKVENPGQFWNAITVGAYCDDIETSSSIYRNCSPVADVGEISPYSSTSVNWNSKWPIKPEILLNGGNMVTNGDDISECEDLELLTTNKDFLTRPLSTLGGTSSATAQASWMAAQIYNEYPDIWPETVRALMIHSASWTDKMIKQFCNDDKKTTGRRILLRTCGYGIPNLTRAIECKNNSVNLVIESEVQPFKKGKMNEMHIHEIPWPKEVLESLGGVDAKLKVTLSYFIEPGPGEVGWKNKYRYPSAGLRFDVINNDETLDEFEKRINYKMRDDDTSVDTKSRDWYLGTSNRDVGSIHSDFCEASAVDLCEANYIAVYPVVGWWRERAYLGQYNRKLRYSLIVSIETPETETDLYTEIMTQVEVGQAIEIDIPTDFRDE